MYAYMYMCNYKYMFNINKTDINSIKNMYRLLIYLYLALFQTHKYMYKYMCMCIYLDIYTNIAYNNLIK